MNKYEIEREVAYEWVENPQVIKDIKALDSWKKSERSYQIKDSIYDTAKKDLAKLKVGVRVRSKDHATTLTAKRYMGQGDAGESIFEEYHKDLSSDEHPFTLSTSQFELNLPKIEILQYLEFINRRIEVTFELGNSKIIFINEVVTYANSLRAYTEMLLEVEFLNVEDSTISAVRNELEKTYSLKMYREGKTDRAQRFLSQLAQKPLIENIDDVATLEMSAHGGKGLMKMKFFHQPYNAFTSPEVDAKVTGYQKSSWDFFGYACLPVGAEIKEHLHDTTDEIYFVINGSATMNVDGVDAIIRKGDCILTRKGSKHSVRNVTSELEFIASEIKA